MKKKVIKYISLGNKDGLYVTFCTLGASIYSIRYNHRLMTLSPKQKSDFLRPDIYHGKTIGPVCGRIKNGKLFIKDKEYDYPVNEGKNTLHGGPDGFSTRIFDYELLEKGIRFTCKDEKATYTIDYLFFEKDELRINFNVGLFDEMVLSLTNHSYFTLGSRNILKTKLMINAPEFIEVNPDDLIPERIRKVPKCLDFRKPRNIGRCINNPYLKNSKTNGYDHSLILEDVGCPVILENKKYRLTINSSFEAVQIYSDNYENGVEMIGTKDKVYRGIAIEPQEIQLYRQAYHDIYGSFITYKFEKKI